MEVANETWLIQKAKNLAENGDVWRTRNFLLTARSLCPESLKLRVIEYKLELEEENLSSCSRLLKEMFDEFSSKHDLWSEIIPLVQDVQKPVGSIKKVIFKSLPPKVQQKMIINCAKFHPSFLDRSHLYLLLIEQFPTTAPEYGLALAERLIQKEKEAVESGNLQHPVASNQYRKLLVRKLLPLLCQSSELEASNKQFYKWLQKAIEHHTSTFTSSDAAISNENAWKELSRVRDLIGKQCGWKELPAGMNFKETKDFLLNLYNDKSESRDVDDGVRRKQVFYTSIGLMLEAASKYMKTLDPAIFVDHASDTPAYILLPNELQYTKQKQSNVVGDLMRNVKLNEYFCVAIECLNLLNADNGFEKDFNMLTRRWKIEKWIWYQLFLVNVDIFESEKDIPLSRLNELQQRIKDDSCTLQYRQRISCHLAMVNFLFPSTENAQRACDFACQFISTFSKRDISNDQQVYCSLSAKINSKMVTSQVYPLSLTCILPIFVDRLVRSIKESPKFKNKDDNALGHVVTLLQHDWPEHEAIVKHVMDIIREKQTFQLSKFIHHIQNEYILEELAYIHNNQTCRFLIGGDRGATGAAGTLQAEQVMSVLVSCMNRSPAQHINHVIIDYLANNREFIVETLSTFEEHVQMDAEEL